MLLLLSASVGRLAGWPKRNEMKEKEEDEDDCELQMSSAFAFCLSLHTGGVCGFLLFRKRQKLQP